MFAVKSIVIARQLDELRAESAARRLARNPSADETPSPTRAHRRWSVLDDPGPELPTITSYPYPAR